ncbi:MAG: YraN family protein [Phaeodactylibacter sp.]|nr:YraN family protein [Phaeodactylibacter sp.]MCB9051468.1 YraN family protein [Lewinellaceae bacterium]
MARHNEVGKKGESLARYYLEEQGYRILEANWRYRRAEVDLIAMDGPVLVFVEVKTRASDAFGKPEEFVTTQKEKLIVDAAIAYMEAIGHDWELRFDIISILYQNDSDYQLEHFRDAFFPGLEG